MCEFDRKPGVAPDLILLGGNVVTLWPELPRAEAVAVRGGSIAAVGTDREMLELAGRRTSVIQCEGRCIVPGFYDAHIHLAACASRRLSVDCSPGTVGSIPRIQQAIRQQAQSIPPGTWIRAGDYDEFHLSEGRHPTRWDLDVAAPDHPVKLQHRSHHACVLNSAALQLAGIGRGVSPPRGAGVDVDPLTHEPTGLLYGYEGHLNANVIPRVNEGELRQSLLEVFSGLLASGVTSVQDAGFSNGLPEWNRFSDICSKGGSHPRIGFMVGQPHLGQFVERGFGPGFGGEWLRVGAVKIMLTEIDGDFHPSPEALQAQIKQATGYGYQVAIHAVEESTICVAIEAIAATREGDRPAHRIEHCSVLPPPLLHRLAELGIVVVTQPGFLFHSGERYLAQVDGHLQQWLYPIRSLLDGGVEVGAGSDAPVAPAHPLEGICSAVTRESRGGRVVGEHERVSAEQALRLYTLGAARACGQQSRKGSIEPGKLADLVVLSEDVTAVEPREIKNIEVEMTVIGGQVVWQREHQSTGR